MDEAQRRKAIGERIKQLRLEKGLTQGDLATIVRKTRTTITKLESGENELTPAMRLSISGYFGVNEQWLLEGKEPKYTATATLTNALEEKAKGLGKEAHRLFLLMKNAYQTRAQFAAEEGLGIKDMSKLEILVAINKLIKHAEKTGKGKETIEIIEKLIKKTK